MWQNWLSPCGCLNTNVVRAVQRLPLVLPAPISLARSQQQWSCILAVVLVSAASTPPACPLCHLTALLGLCMGRSGRDELRMNREYTLVWESPKYSQKWDDFWKHALEIPSYPYHVAARLEGGIQDWTCVTLAMPCPLPERITPMMLLNLEAAVGKTSHSFFAEKKNKLCFLPCLGEEKGVSWWKNNPEKGNNAF